MVPQEALLRSMPNAVQCGRCQYGPIDHAPWLQILMRASKIFQLLLGAGCIFGVPLVVRAFFLQVPPLFARCLQ